MVFHPCPLTSLFHHGKLWLLAGFPSQRVGLNLCQRAALTLPKLEMPENFHFTQCSPGQILRLFFFFATNQDNLSVTWRTSVWD